MALSGPHASVTSAAHTNEVCSSDSSGGSSMLNTTAATPLVVATTISPTMKRPRRQRHRTLRSSPGRARFGRGTGVVGRFPAGAFERAGGSGGGLLGGATRGHAGRAAGAGPGRLASLPTRPRRCARSRPRRQARRSRPRAGGGPPPRRQARAPTATATADALDERAGVERRRRARGASRPTATSEATPEHGGGPVEDQVAVEHAAAAGDAGERQRRRRRPTASARIHTSPPAAGRPRRPRRWRAEGERRQPLERRRQPPGLRRGQRTGLGPLEEPRLHEVRRRQDDRQRAEPGGDGGRGAGRPARRGRAPPGRRRCPRATVELQRHAVARRARRRRRPPGAAARRPPPAGPPARSRRRATATASTRAAASAAARSPTRLTRQLTRCRGGTSWRGGSRSTTGTPRPRRPPAASGPWPAWPARPWLVMQRPDAGQPGAERVGDQHDVVLLADRALHLGGLAGRLGRPPELGVGVAHLVARQPALPELRHDAHAGQPVVDDPARALLPLAAAERLGPERHRRRGYRRGPSRRP